MKTGVTGLETATQDWQQSWIQTEHDTMEHK